MNHGELFLVGATHRTAPLGLRERLALTVENEALLAAELRGIAGLEEFVILNTCNRVEIYGVGSNPHQRQRVIEAFCRRQGFAPLEFARVSLDLTGPVVVQHLLEVASGLDSQMIGENEIFGQVKKAFLAAQTRESAGPVLNRIFQKTFQAAKHVRTHTAITAGLVSIPNVAVELALRIFGNLAGTRVLLLGAGEMGLKSGRAFRSRGPGALVVASRRLERAQEAATELGATAVAFDAALADLGSFDVVVCSTSAPSAVISPAQAAAAMRQRQGRPVFFIDLAMPRDVDGAVGALKDVFVYNLDDLAKIAGENREARQAEVIRCRAILQDKAHALWAQLDRAARARSQPAGNPAGLFADPAPVACVA
jgi:glutamyl-tRNA reductase